MTSLSHILSRPIAALSLLAVVGLMGLAATGCDEAAPSTDVDNATGPLEDGQTTPDTDTLDAADAVEVDILYPGYVCGEDDQCSTGLCYGTATAQGAFDPPKCQTKCLDTFDFSKYCDSDDDCCKGRCCIGCGSREGLCVLE